MKIKVPLFFAVLTFLIGLTLCCPFYVMAQDIPGDPVPISRTPLEIKERKLELILFEDLITVESSFTLNNPTDRKRKIRLRFPLAPVDYVNTEAEFQALAKDEEIKTSYNTKEKAYYWDITLEPSEELELKLKYPLKVVTDNNQNLILSYSAPLSPLWAGQEKIKSSLSLIMKEIHPGQISDIKPETYKILRDSLDWSWEGPLNEKITVTASINKELNRWIQPLTPEDRAYLGRLLEIRDYLGIAKLFNKKSSTAKKEEREDFQVAKAYYLTKAQGNAGELWEDLYQDKALSSRVYWELGKEYEGQIGKLLELYQRVKEFQVHPLTQSWLAAQIPSSRIKLNPPEFVLATAHLEEDNSGLVVKGHFSDKDGDIEQLILKYHWEDEAAQEISFPLEPFHYDYTPSQFIPAKNSLQRLFYEFIILDKAGKQTTSGTKESFYLNSEIYSETYMLDGANLVLGDYPPDQQDEVRKWFMSYLKMAGEAQFVPIKAKSPYFIFLGQEHDFINTYSGPHFIMYTPVPFSPEATKLHVHRYFLSHWYGQGWQNPPDNELNQLGDALLLGKGRYAMVMKYLLDKDVHKFADLLGTIGQGVSWKQALLDVYLMPFWIIQLKTIWFIYGNMVLAVLIIISFAWLGKSGYLIRIINFFRKA